MSDSYTQLLDAAIDHVQSLKKGGTKFLAVSSETLKALQQSPLAKASEPPKVPTRVAPAGWISTPVVSRIAPVAPSRPSPAPASVPTASVSLAAPRVSLTEAQRAEKETAMAALNERVKGCVKCPNLVSSRKNVVFGVGDIHSPLMFVGEAPGADEDIQGEPFVGAAGQLLTKIIVAMGQTRQSVYIANILKCRPDTPGQTSGNRKPTPAEMQTCLPHLLEQIDLIKPQVIVALGATAMEGLMGSTESISRVRGHFQNYRGVPLMPTFHPSYLLRNQAVTEKRKVWEDMLQVMEKLGLPISAKQRGYFLK